MESKYEELKGLILSGRKEEALTLAKGEDPQLYELLLSFYYIVSSQPHKALRIAQRLSASSEGWVRAKALRQAAMAYAYLGDKRRAITTCEQLKKDDATRITLAFLKFSLGDAREALKELAGVSEHREEKLYLEGMLNLVRGHLSEAEKALKALLGSSKSYIGGALELLGVAQLLKNNLWEAVCYFLGSYTWWRAAKSLYQVFPYLKALETAKLLGFSLELPVPPLRSRSPLLKAAEMLKRAIDAWRAQEFALAGRALLSVGQPLEASLALLRAYELSGDWAYLLEIPESFSAFVPGKARQFSGEPEARVWLFGKLRFEGIAPPEEWHSKRALRLFIYLLLNRGKALARSYLCSLLWPEEDERVARRRLTVVASHARRCLGKLGKHLKRLGDAYYLDAPIWVDAWEFEDLAKKGLKEALTLCRGELLPELEDDPIVAERRAYFEGLKQRLT